MKAFTFFYMGFFLPLINSAVPGFYSLTVSKLCPRNKYVIKYENGTKKCKRCSRCHKGFQIQRECSTFEDTICEPCPSGSYNGVTGSNCKSCSICTPGEYVRRPCTAKRDTKCRKCPKGYFTLSGNVTSCVPCKRCRQNEKLIAKCDGIRDTVCGECDDSYFRVSSSGSCLKCSKCPSTLQYLVVPECRDKLGIHNSNICWPQPIKEEKNDSREEILDIEETILEDPVENYILIYNIVPVALGLILIVFVGLFFVFAILRFTKCENCMKLIIDKCSSTREYRYDVNHRSDVEKDNECRNDDDDVFIDTDSIEPNDYFNKVLISENSVYKYERTTFENKS